jgi:hypothetical protein
MKNYDRFYGNIKLSKRKISRLNVYKRPCYVKLSSIVWKIIFAQWFVYIHKSI